MQGVWGFIDCTVQPMCCSSYYQHQAYNGHKNFHSLKYQAVMLLNGLFGHLYGLIEGQHNDALALDESGLVDECALYARCLGGGEGDVEASAVNGADTFEEVHYLQLFGDPAYGLNKQIISPFPRPG